jgi:hypothetical protein
MIPQYSAENAALSDGPASANTEAWHVHEHVADSAKVQAQALVEQVGSVALAKQAIEAVGEAVVHLASDKNSGVALEEFLGFASREELESASSPIDSNDGKSWFLTELRGGAWTVWNTLQQLSARQFQSRDEAVASIPRENPLSGSAMLT